MIYIYILYYVYMCIQCGYAWLWFRHGMVDGWLTKGITAGGQMNQPASGDELARFLQGNPSNVFKCSLKQYADGLEPNIPWGDSSRFQMGSQNPQNPKQRSHPKILAKYQLFLLEADLETWQWHPRQNPRQRLETSPAQARTCLV